MWIATTRVNYTLATDWEMAAQQDNTSMIGIRSFKYINVKFLNLTLQLLCKCSFALTELGGPHYKHNPLLKLLNCPLPLG